MSWFSSALDWAGRNVGGIVKTVAVGALGVPGAASIISTAAGFVGDALGSINGQAQVSADNSGAAAGALYDQALIQSQQTMAAGTRERQAVGLQSAGGWLVPVAVASGAALVLKKFFSSNNNNGRGSRRRR